MVSWRIWETWKICKISSLIFFSSICGRRFAKSSNLKTHEKIHDKLGNTKLTLSLSECPKCSKKWERLGKSLETHILNCSGVLDKKGSYRYQCFVCQKNFQTRSATADHLALLHNYHISNVKNFCFICKEEFEDILTHARNHNCPFQCEIVRKMFRILKAWITLFFVLVRLQLQNERKTRESHSKQT